MNRNNKTVIIWEIVVYRMLIMIIWIIVIIIWLYSNKISNMEAVIIYKVIIVGRIWRLVREGVLGKDLIYSLVPVKIYNSNNNSKII